MEMLEATIKLTGLAKRNVTIDIENWEGGKIKMRFAGRPITRMHFNWWDIAEQIDRHFSKLDFTRVMSRMILMMSSANKVKLLSSMSMAEVATYVKEFNEGGLEYKGVGFIVETTSDPRFVQIFGFNGYQRYNSFNIFSLAVDREQG